MCNVFNWTSSRQDLVVLDPNVIGECLVRHPDLPPPSYKGSSPPQRVASALFRFPPTPASSPSKAKARMSITESILDADARSVLVLIPAVFLVVHVVPYFVDPHCIRRNGVKGPFWAQFSDAWLGLVTGQGHRSEVVHDLHQKYGEWNCH